MRYFIAIQFILLQCFGSQQIKAQLAQPHYSEDVEDKITQVEHNLAGRFRLTDSTFHYELSQRMQFYKVQGVSIAVIHNYKIEWARGYGWADSSEQRPVTVETLFQAGAMSKSINAVGILKLVQDGKINLTDNINHYFKTFKFDSDSLTRYRNITMANLLSHTAGFTVHYFQGYQKGSDMPTIIQVLHGQKPANNEAIISQFDPGTRVEYSGGGIMISQLIVMDVTHEPYNVYQLDNVLTPLSMTNSFFTEPPPAEKLNSLATGYDGNGKEINGKYHIYPEMAAAGLWSNPTDFAKYIIEMQLSYIGKSNKILPQTMTRKMLTPYIHGTSAGLGVFIEKRGTETYFQHLGANAGFSCKYYGSLVGGNGVVVMANSDNSPIIEEIINSVGKVYDWRGFFQNALHKIIQISPNTLAEYVGQYTLKDILLTVIEKDGGLYFLQNRYQASQLYFTSRSDFFLSDSEIEGTFTKDSSGKIIGVKIHQNGSLFNLQKLHN